jgi:hypothetical protein
VSLLILAHRVVTLKKKVLSADTIEKGQCSGKLVCIGKSPNADTMERDNALADLSALEEHSKFPSRAEMETSCLLRD